MNCWCNLERQKPHVFFVGNRQSVLAKRRFNTLLRVLPELKLFFFDIKSLDLYDDRDECCFKSKVKNKVLKHVLSPILFIRLLMKHHVKMIHFHGASTLLLSLFLVLKNDYCIITTPQGSEVNELYTGLSSVFTCFLLQRSNIVTVKSKFLENCVKKVCSSPTIELNWGLDDCFFSLLPEIPRSKIRIVSARASQRLYNIDTVFNAAKLLKTKRDDFEFVYVEFNKETGYVLDMDVPDVVLKELRSEEIAALFQQSDIVVSIPSYDGFSTTVMEAMASGPYQIISDINSYDNMFDDERILKKIDNISAQSLAAELNNLCERISTIRSFRGFRREYARSIFSKDQQMMILRHAYFPQRLPR